MSSASAKAKLRLLFEIAPLGLLIEKAGGESSCDGRSVSTLDVEITEIDQRTQARDCAVNCLLVLRWLHVRRMAVGVLAATSALLCSAELATGLCWATSSCMCSVDDNLRWPAPLPKVDSGELWAAPRSAPTLLAGLLRQQDRGGAL